MTRAAHVRKQSLTTTAAAALVALTLVACEDGIGPEGLEVVPATIEAVGDTAALATVGNRADVRWISLDPSIVTVSTAGVAIAKAPGTARVEAKSRGRTTIGRVTVLPAAEVQVWQAGLAPEGADQEKLTLRLRNLGGRGGYRLEVYRRGPAGTPVPVLIDRADIAAPAGMDIQYTTWLTVPQGALHAGDWVVVRSREGSAGPLRATSCVLLHGEGICLIP